MFSLKNYFASRLYAAILEAFSSACLNRELQNKTTVSMSPVCKLICTAAVRFAL
jgi:hypothetical protein